MKRFFKEVYIKGHGKEDKNTFDTFKDTKFYKVNPNPIGTSPIDVEIEEWKDCENLEYITFSGLDKKFKV